MRAFSNLKGTGPTVTFLTLFLKGGVHFATIWENENFFRKNDPTTPNFMRGIDCAHRKILKNFFGGQKIEKNASKLGVVSFNPNKILRKALKFEVFLSRLRSMPIEKPS